MALNEVQTIFNSMTNEELSQAIKEMKEDNPLGFIRENGIIREKCKMVHNIVGGNVYLHLTMTEVSILREAAYRFTPEIN